MASEIPELPPKQLIPWLRNKINDYSDLADKLEKVFGTAVSVHQQPPLVHVAHVAYDDSVSLSEDALATAINHRSARVHGIAARLKVSEEHIHSLIEASNGRIYVAERGWLKVRE